MSVLKLPHRSFPIGGPLFEFEAQRAMKRNGTLLLRRSDIRGLLPFDAYINALEDAFRLYAAGKVLKTGLMHIDSHEGEFHIKAGGVDLPHRFFGIKVNAGFFRNVERFGMRNIQGVILLCDGENGYPLVVMDSGEVTVNRTGAAAAIAAKHLARRESSSVLICGCGAQGAIQLVAMHAVLPIKTAYVFDIDKSKSEKLAAEMSKKLAIEVVAVDDPRQVSTKCDVCVTCTPSRKAYLSAKDISPGTFIAAMGADSPEKQELDPQLLVSNKTVVDLLEQCAVVGELHHALDAGMSKSSVHSEIHEIVVGKKPGRVSGKETIVFDATGTALQDVAAAAAIYEKAIALGLGDAFGFFE